MQKLYKNKWMALLSLIPLVNLVFVFLYLANSDRDIFKKHVVYFVLYIVGSLLLFFLLPEDYGLLVVWAITVAGSFLAFLGVRSETIIDVRAVRIKFFIFIGVFVLVIGLFAGIFAAVLHSTDITARTERMIEAVIEQDYDKWSAEVFPETDLQKAFNETEIQGTIDSMFPTGISYHTSGDRTSLTVRYRLKTDRKTYTVEVSYEERANQEGVIDFCVVNP